MASFSTESAERFSWYCALLLAFLLLMSYCESSNEGNRAVLGRRGLNDRPCDEIYVVGEGETLHTISDKCGDPFIVEENPHIQNDDDVYPGLVIKITPFSAK